jgi:hypothetical protein
MGGPKVSTMYIDSINFSDKRLGSMDAKFERLLPTRCGRSRKSAVGRSDSSLVQAPSLLTLT